jgi:hypothetical protein
LSLVLTLSALAALAASRNAFSGHAAAAAPKAAAPKAAAPAASAPAGANRPLGYSGFFFSARRPAEAAKPAAVAPTQGAAPMAGRALAAGPAPTVGQAATAGQAAAVGHAPPPAPGDSNAALIASMNSFNNSFNRAPRATPALSQPLGPPVMSRTFEGHPGPAGSVESQGPGGIIVRKAADGSVLDIHDAGRGMRIHYPPGGGTRVTVEESDRSRIEAASRGIQYVQHPYAFGGHSFDHRTYYMQGNLLHQLYRPYAYAGKNLDVYATSRFYNPKVYQWANTRFNAPQPYNWLYKTKPPPWYARYLDYFTPDATYDSPTPWLTDYLLASTLALTYAIDPPQSATEARSGATVISPNVKQMLSAEVGRQIQQESFEAQENAHHHELVPGAGSIVQELGDRQSHVFVVASELDLVDLEGRRCSISGGDVVQVLAEPEVTSTARAIVLASKGSLECGRSVQVQIALADLQEMQNHMRETIDQALANTDIGKTAPTVTPAYVAAVPPPDADAKQEIDKEMQVAAEIAG